MFDKFVTSSNNESCDSSRVLVTGVEIKLNLSHLPPLGLLFTDLSGLMTIASSSDAFISSSLSESSMTISSARISKVSYVDVVADVTG